VPSRGRVGETFVCSAPPACKVSVEPKQPIYLQKFNLPSVVCVVLAVPESEGYHRAGGSEATTVSALEGGKAGNWWVLGGRNQSESCGFS